jgi:predicted dehydrogenase
MDPPLRVAIAGCGRISELGHVPAFRLVEEARLCAVADPDRGRRERLATSANGDRRAFASVAEMVGEVRPDAVIVASPPELHLEHAVLAAEGGAHVLVEKPPGRGREEAEHLTRLGRPVWVGFNRRFSHLGAVAGAVPTEGELRLALQISYRRASWRAHQVRDDALGDLGPHLADLAACLLDGELSAARAVQIDPHRARVELVGKRGVAEVLCEIEAPWRERVEVRGGDGRLAARSVHGGSVRGLAARLRGRDHPLVDSLARQLRSLARAVAGEGDGTLATARDGALAMSALDAAGRSAARGGALTPV